MVRLTAELIAKAPQYLNAVKEREIDLRGNKIAAIENLGVTGDQYDSIDLTDNEIVKLDGFPELYRLTTLLVSNNRISRIGPSIGEYLPKLETLVLTNNRLVNLWELDPLASLTNLQTLSLLENVVSKQPYYRLYVISKIPSLRILDFSKVKMKERQAAKARFSLPEQEQEQAGAVAATAVFVPGEVMAPVPDEVVEQGGRRSEQDVVFKTAVRAALQNAQTLEEVSRLERVLQSGQIPADISIPGYDPANNQQAMEEG